MPRRSERHAALQLLAALLASCHHLAAAVQTCGSVDALTRAAGTGLADDAAALSALDSSPSTGLIYLPAGAAFLLASPLTLRKPLLGEAGAVLVVRAPLILLSQPDHPPVPLFDVQGPGRVEFGPDAVRVLPEWFGAVGDGTADDSPAVRAAYAAAAASGGAMLYLQRTYALGSELVFGTGVTVLSTPTARFVPYGGNPAGVTFGKGGFPHKQVLPHFQGFSGFCFRLLGSDLGAFQLQTLSGCGDAVRLEMVLGAQPSDDSSTVLDNTVWFDAVADSQVAVAIRAGPGCTGAACVMQGNQVVGRSITGCGAAGGLTAAVAWFSRDTAPAPSWDANQFNLGVVVPCKARPEYRLWYASPEGYTATEVLKVASMGAVPPGASLFEGYHLVLQASITLREVQPAGAGALRGLASLVEWGGQTTPPAGHDPIKAATAPGSSSRAKFNGGRALLGNFFSVRAVPTSDWEAGEARKFYVYHEMATGELYHIKCDAVRQSSGLPLVGCLQAQDNSQAGSRTPQEIELTLINLSGQTVARDGAGLVFQLAVAAMGSP